MKHYQPIRNYETTAIFRPTLSEAELHEQMGALKTLIESSGNTLHKQEVWGKRRLAYSINGFGEGIYVHFLFTGEPKFIAELTRRYQINENVIRYLTIRCEHALDELPPVSLEEAPDSGEGRGGDEERKPRHAARHVHEDDEDDDEDISDDSEDDDRDE